MGVLTHPGVNFGEFASMLAISSLGEPWVLVVASVGCANTAVANRSCDAARTQLARDDAATCARVAGIAIDCGREQSPRNSRRQPPRMSLGKFSSGTPALGDSESLAQIREV